MSQPDLIIHDEKDNVGVVVIETTKKGQDCNAWIMENDKTIKVPSTNDVPLGHKIALKDLKVGDTIFKYGHDIGKVVKEIKKGEHVHVHNVKTKKWKIYNGYPKKFFRLQKRKWKSWNKKPCNNSSC